LGRAHGEGRWGEALAASPSAASLAAWGPAAEKRGSWAEPAKIVKLRLLKDF
jgi:hypothetical protein